MSAATRLFAWLAPALLTGAAIVGAAQDSTPPFVWLADLDAARAKAKLEGKPVLAVFRCVP